MGQRSRRPLHNAWAYFNWDKCRSPILEDGNSCGNLNNACQFGIRISVHLLVLEVDPDYRSFFRHRNQLPHKKVKVSALSESREFAYASIRTARNAHSRHQTPPPPPSFLKFCWTDCDSDGEYALFSMANNISDGVLTSFSASSQMKQGNYFLDQARELLRIHFQLIEAVDRVAIRTKLDEFVCSFYIPQVVG